MDPVRQPRQLSFEFDAPHAREAICQGCGVLFVPGPRSRGILCRRGCQLKKERHQIPCQRCGLLFTACGVIFQVRPSELSNKHCSIECKQRAISERTEKLCSVCGALKPLSEFLPIGWRAGHRSQCRSCDGAYRRRRSEEARDALRLALASGSPAWTIQPDLWILTTCKSCGNPRYRQKRDLPRWSGLCRSCRTKEIWSSPGRHETHRQAMREYAARPNKPWRGGRNPVPPSPRLEQNRLWRYLRRQKCMADWAKAIKARDDYTCAFCGQRGGKLHSDHILGYTRYPQYALALWNGRTLCKACHKWRHDLYGGFSKS